MGTAILFHLNSLISDKELLPVLLGRLFICMPHFLFFHTFLESHKQQKTYLFLLQIYFVHHKIRIAWKTILITKISIISTWEKYLNIKLLLHLHKSHAAASPSPPPPSSCLFFFFLSQCVTMTFHWSFGSLLFHLQSSTTILSILLKNCFL